MSPHEIEQALAQLEAPEPPEDLRARCLATIPAGAGHALRHDTFWEKLKMKRLQIALAATVGLLMAMLVWGVRPGTQSGAAVFAATLDAMGKVPFAHMKGRTMGFAPGSGKPTWYTGRWIVEESWFDVEQGIYKEMGGETFASQQSLNLPDGRIYGRVEDRLKITSFDPRQWERTRTAVITHHVRLATAARGFNYGVDPRLVATAPGEWKGRKATVLTYEAPPSAENAATGAPTVRTLFYVDPDTDLCMAKQQFSRVPEGGEGLVLEWEFAYSQKPDRSRFDPSRMEQGATAIFRAQGKPGESLNPPEALGPPAP